MIFKRIGLIGLLLAQMIMLGHDLIPHHHEHHHDHDSHHDHNFVSKSNDRLSHLNHRHSPGDEKNEKEQKGPHLLNIFCFVHHQNEEIFLFLNLPGDQQNGTFDFNFAGITENSIFENITLDKPGKEPLNHLRCCNFQLVCTYGLRAPPTV